MFPLAPRETRHRVTRCSKPNLFSWMRRDEYWRHSPMVRVSELQCDEASPASSKVRSPHAQGTRPQIDGLAVAPSRTYAARSRKSAASSAAGITSRWLHSIKKVEAMRRSDGALNCTITHLMDACVRPCALARAVRSSSLGRNPLFQLCVLRLGLLQDRDIGVGVFPEGEEILVSGAGFGIVTLKRIGATKAEMGQ